MFGTPSLSFPRRQFGFWHPNSANGFSGLIRPRINALAFRRLDSGRVGRIVPTDSGARRVEFSKFLKPVPVRDVNTQSQPWQRHARKLAERAKSHLGWNARREAREARKAAALAEASIG